jgi:hypothetical protein
MDISHIPNGCSDFRAESGPEGSGPEAGGGTGSQETTGSGDPEKEGQTPKNFYTRLKILKSSLVYSNAIQSKNLHLHLQVSHSQSIPCWPYLLSQPKGPEYVLHMQR